MNHNSTQGSPLAFRNGALGDMVMFLPVLSAIAERESAEKVDLLVTGRWSETILSLHPKCGQIVTLPGVSYRPLWLSKTKRQARDWIQAQAPKSIYLFERNDKLLDLLRKASGKNTTIQRLANKAPDSMLHQVDDLLEFVLPDLPKDSPLRYPSLAEARLEMDETRQFLRSQGIDENKKLVLIQAGNRRTSRGGKHTRSSNVKYWPIERWAEVIKALNGDDPDVHFILCGSPGEFELNQGIAKLAAVENISNLANSLPVARLMALCRLAHSMISVDTGPAHLAGALGCPLVVLFGTTSPYRFAPRSLAPVVVVTEKSFAFETESYQWDADCALANIASGNVCEAWRAMVSR